jgi:clan AA aspartic protease (TIGR02281 family)
VERKLALWLGVPFVVVAWMLIAVVALAPGVINSRLSMLLLLVLSSAGILILLIRMALRDRENSALADALYPFAGILVAIVLGFHEQVGAAGRGIVSYATPGSSVSEGTRFARADDGQFHISLTINGTAVDFMVEPSTPFNVLMPDVPKQIGINPSSLVYDHRLELAKGSAEYASDVVLPKVQLGTTIIENLPLKVFATGRGHNILGKPFFDRLDEWRIDGDALIIVNHD